MSRSRRATDRLQQEGHLAGASDSLLAELSDVLADKQEQARIEGIRRAMMLAVEPVPGTEFFIDRIQGAMDLPTLWSLRDELLVVVSEHNEARRATQILEPITAMFLGESSEPVYSAAKPAVKKRSARGPAKNARDSERTKTVGKRPGQPNA